VRGASRGMDECRMLEALGRRDPTWFSVSLGGIVDRSSAIGTWALFELSSPGLSVPLFFRGRLRGDKCGEFPDCIDDDELWWTGSPWKVDSLGDLSLDAILKECGLI
jgi:hypothetical protein